MSYKGVVLIVSMKRLKIISLIFITAVPLTVIGMDWNPLPETVCRMDAASERTWTYLQRVSGNGLQFMSLIAANNAKACSTSALSWIARQLTGQQ